LTTAIVYVIILTLKQRGIIMAKPSVAAYLRKMNNQQVIKRVSGVRTVDDIDQMREDLKKLLADNNIPEEQLAEDDVKFFIKEGVNFWMKPKLHKEQKGTLVVRSKDYLFIPEGKTESEAIYGDKKGFTYYPDEIKVEKVLNPNPRIGGLVSFELA
tara:strand:+ start:5836 stop:6303 length:468 start_codon:yes stop_codon:yes gene_type:complete